MFLFYQIVHSWFIEPALVKNSRKYTGSASFIELGIQTNLNKLKRAHLY